MTSTVSIAPSRNSFTMNSTGVFTSLKPARSETGKPLAVRLVDETVIREGDTVVGRSALDAGKPALTVELTTDEQDIARQCFLLSDKPTIFACNVKDSELATADQRARDARRAADARLAEANRALARSEADRSIAGGKLEAAKLAVSRFRSHSHGPGNVSSKSLMSKTSRRSGEA